LRGLDREHVNIRRRIHLCKVRRWDRNTKLRGSGRSRSRVACSTCELRTGRPDSIRALGFVYARGSQWPEQYRCGRRSKRSDQRSQQLLFVLFAQPGPVVKFTFYTPNTNYTITCGNGPCVSSPPQEFIVVNTSEPMTILMLGRGLAGLLFLGGRQRLSVSD